MARIAVIGTGYVGLTTGACLASLGHHVACLDIDESKVSALQRGEIPIVEHGLGRLVRDGLASRSLIFTTDPAVALTDASIVFLCLPTPQGADGSADLSFVEQACLSISPLLEYEAIVVNKSTVPVGSASRVESMISRADVTVVSNPEFLREGSAVHDFLHPDRIVIGANDQESAMKVASLYDSLGARTVITDTASAELVKYASNAFLATKLSFINAIATLAEKVGADINDVVVGLGSDHRIGEHFLRPGPGWGGSCFPKDTRALINISQQVGFEFEMLKSVLDENERQFSRIADKITHAAGGSLEKKVVAVWGLTFKARTDDLRDSPSLAVIDRLLEIGATIRAFDPTVQARLGELSPKVEVTTSPIEACRGADVLAVMTEWEEFKRIQPVDVAQVIRSRQIVDCRNILDAHSWRNAGFLFQSIGRR